MLGGLADDAGDGAARIEEALKCGGAAEIFGRMIAAQGGRRLISSSVIPIACLRHRLRAMFSQPKRVLSRRSTDRQSAMRLFILAVGG